MAPLRVSVVMLAGSLRPSELQAAVGQPAVCLPVAPGETVLGRWCRRFGSLPGFAGGLVAVSTEPERAAVEAVRPADCPLSVVADPRPWRGMAGLLRDVRSHLPACDVVLVVEAGTLPPEDLGPLLTAIEPGHTALAVGTDASGQAAGAYALEFGLLDRIQDVGYRDLKEQLLPELHADGVAARPVVLGPSVIRLRRREGYLRAVAAAMNAAAETGVSQREPRADGDADGVRWVRSLVSPGARVSEKAVLADAVVLDGASVADDAIVSRAVIGPGARVEAGERVVDRILTATPPSA